MAQPQVSKGHMDSEVQIKQIVLNRMERCTVCHHEFATDDIHVISRKPDIWTMLVECTDCHSRNFVAAVLNDGDPKEAQLALRRLSEQAIKEIKEPVKPEIESEAPATGDRVTASDVLDIHQFLDDFDGDFKALFKKPA
jgi:chromosome condensin MukBEF MukE localization factor